MTDTPHDKLFTGLFSDLNKSQSGTPPRAASQSTDATPHLNPRSCVTCRKRKVRCDKHEPCGNCVKAQIDCVFPAPGRAPRKPRKPMDAELLKRLRRLEGVVQSLGAQVDEPTDAGTVTIEKSPVHSPSSSQVVQNHDSTDSLPAIGKLVISHGRSRYVSNAYWATLENEIEDMKDILDQSSDDDELEHSTPENYGNYDSSEMHGFIFGFSSLAVDLRKLYPSPSQIFIIWEVFKENIDPVVKILHCPSAKNLILRAAVNTDNLGRQSECLFFAICFASVVSMTNEQCESLLGDSKIKLWKRYRFATEQALARANFLNSSSLMVLQSMVFYLICLRYLDDSKSVWALGGLVIHLSYTLGLHRDGTLFGLDPFECEMRRRLWWHINIIDIRAAEDHGTDLRTTATTFDTQLPCNVNDEDIWPGMKEPPTAAVGATEMTFCLVRFELSNMTRGLGLLSTPLSQSMTPEEIKEKEDGIDVCHKEIEEKYIKHLNMNTPIYWVSATVGRLILAKMWLKLHHPRLAGKGLYAHPHIRERVFVTSVEVVEFGHLLESNENTAKWAWLFRTYMQWHAVAHVLSELCVRGPSPATDRAWRAIEAIYEDSDHAKRQRGMLWKPIRQLYSKADAHRQRTSKDMSGAKFEPSSFVQEDAGPGSAGSGSVAASANALDFDFQEAGLLPATTSFPVSELELEQEQQGAQDIMNWDDWDVSTATTQPIYPFSYNAVGAQEWF